MLSKLIIIIIIFFAAGIGQQKGPNYPPQQFLTIHCTISASKVEQTGLWSFASSVIFTWSLANWLPLLQAPQQPFIGEELPQAGGRKSFPRVCQISKQWFLCYRNKQTFLIGKNVLIAMVPILINKDMLEPSYNDLNITVQNHSYFCTNLIYPKLN